MQRKENFGEGQREKSWSANELPINLQAWVVLKRFLYMQHLFGGLSGIEQGRNWAFKKFLDTYFLKISTEVGKHHGGTKKN